MLRWKCWGGSCSSGLCRLLTSDPCMSIDTVQSRLMSTCGSYPLRYRPGRKSCRICWSQNRVHMPIQWSWFILISRLWVSAWIFPLVLAYFSSRTSSWLCHLKKWSKSWTSRLCQGSIWFARQGQCVSAFLQSTHKLVCCACSWRHRPELCRHKVLPPTRPGRMDASLDTWPR